MAGTFAAEVGEWSRATEGAIEAIFKESAQRVVEDMQKTRAEGGRMRVDTGYLRASLMASTSAMPVIRKGAVPPQSAAAGSIPYDVGPVNLVIAGADLGGTIYVGYVAEYAAYREYGARGQPGDGFVRLAAQKWPTIVAEVERELMARAGVT